MTRLEAKNPAVRWVKPAGLHITLKFLGDIKEESVAPLSTELDHAASACPQLDLALAGFGAFPNVRRPRVIWVGLEGSMRELLRLASDIDRVCPAFGVAREKRPFASHITLGRLKVPTMVDLAVNPVSGTFSASEILLYKSVLLPGGAQYTVLHRSSLGGKGG